MVLCKGDFLYPCKLPALPGLSREHIAGMHVCKHMDACACFPRRESPLLPTWVNVHHCCSVRENSSHSVSTGASWSVETLRAC